MPGFNRRGPMGQGPMTGRRMGHCTNYSPDLEKNAETTKNTLMEDNPGNFRRGPGFGRWRPRRGMGRQNRFNGGF